MGYVDDHDIITWAEQLLIGDFYSDSIACLAGYPQKQAQVDREDFISYFEQAVSDLRLELPPTEDAHEEYGEYLCRGIIDGSIKPAEGHRALYQLWCSCCYESNTPNSRIFEGFMYLDDSMGILDEGYGPLLDRLEGLSVESYPDFLKEECRLFLVR